MLRPSATSIFKVGALVILAVVLRLHNVGARDFWYDEAFTGITVQAPFEQMIGFLMQDTHPPLYFLLLKGWGSLFNYSVGGLRLFSVVMGAGTVIMMYLLVKELYTERVARHATFLAAINPFAIEYSREARMYALFALCIIVATYFFVRAIKSDRLSDYALWGICLALGCLTHYMAFIFAIAYYAVYVVWKLSEGYQWRWENILDIFLPSQKLLIGYAIGCLLFSLWLPSFWGQFQNREKRITWIQKPESSAIFQTVQIFFFGSPPGSGGVPAPNQWSFVSKVTIYALTIAFFATMSALLWRQEKKKTAAILLLSLGTVVVVYLLSFVGVYYLLARYLIPVAFFLLILLARFLSSIKISYASILLAAYVILLVTIVREPASEGFNALKRNVATYTGDFYVLNSFDYVVAKYYFGAKRVVLYNKDWPAYNPRDWTGINGSLRRTEDLSALTTNPSSIVVYNQQASEGKVDDTFLDSHRLAPIGNYKNIILYAPKKK